MDHSDGMTQGETTSQSASVLEQLLSEVRLMRSENMALREANEETKLKLLALETSIQSIQPTPAPTLAPEDNETTAVPATTNPSITADPANTVITYSPHPTKRPKLRDVPKYSGDKPQWRSWKLETEGKLRVDGEALGDAEGHFMYVFMSLEGKAKDNVTTFAEMQIEKRTFNVAELLNRLELLYGEKDRKQRATRNLHSIKQGENEPFTSFYPRFEKEIANANAEYWPDDSKISYLQEALNDKMKAALIGSDPVAISTYVGLAKRCDSLSSQMELLGQWKKPRGNTRGLDNHGSQSSQRSQQQLVQQAEVRKEDMMEWEPTPQASTQVNAGRTRGGKNTNGYQSRRPEDQALLGKRAKWVDQVEMDARYREGRCLRCGRDNCRINSLEAFHTPETQDKIIKAAAKAGVPWIMPNCYGTDVHNKELARENLTGELALAGIKTIEDVGVSSWITMCCSFWYEFSVAQAPQSYGFDFPNKKITFYDDGKTRINTSTWPQCGRALAALLSLKELPEDENDKSPTISHWRNKPMYISSFLVSQRDMLDSIQRVTGTTDKDWRIEYEGSKARWERGMKLLQSGDRNGHALAMYARTFFPHDGDFESKRGLDNEVLGLPKEDMDEASRRAMGLVEGGYNYMSNRI